MITNPSTSHLIKQSGFVRASLWTVALSCHLALGAFANSVVIYEEDFESYTGAATGLADTSNANPDSPDINIVADNPHGGVPGSAVQLVDWLSRSGNQSLLFRSGADARIRLLNTRSGTRYQFDFWLYVSKQEDTRSFMIILRGMGADSNGDDYFAYRSDRGASPGIFYYSGIGPAAPAWVDTGAVHLEAQWQHHRMIVDTAAQTVDIYIDDMDQAIVSGANLARPDIAVPTQIWIRNEATASTPPFDGYFAIDDLRLTVDGAIDLSTPFRENFESYPARVSEADNANPEGPWITVETEGTGNGRPVVPTKVQVVDSSVVEPRSGSNSLKLEGGQRAGVTVAWGQTAQPDVQITWWARVPASVPEEVATYLRMSLYGAENGDTYQGDCALLGYGSRDANVGGATALTYFVTGTGWVESGVNYTPDVWEEYRLITHTADGSYTLIKNPSSDPEVIADRAPFIGTATTWGPIFMAAWSSSNGTGHPPVYLDDIEIRAITPVSVAISHVGLISEGLLIQWSGTGAQKYRVERATSGLDPAAFEDISGELTTTEFIDPDTSAAHAFYRVVAFE
jgi:hypothetical protein